MLKDSKDAEESKDSEDRLTIPIPRFLAYYSSESSASFASSVSFMKGVLICGGTGSRLRPLTDVTNKSLLPVYDKPLIHYPLDILLKAGIRDIAVVTGTEHMDQIAAYLGSGSRFDCEFAFEVQDKPGGIAQALGLAEEFSDGQSVCAILGDNVFFDDLSPAIRSFKGGGHIFLKEVHDPERFGIAEIEYSSTRVLETRVNVVSIEEKPQQPKSNLAITGCYLYDNRCFEIIRNLKPSARGEFEITDVSKEYLNTGELGATHLRDEWIDAGTFESLYKAAATVRERKVR
jgi:glucose-1-phosphate thymidylyltransferase